MSDEPTDAEVDRLLDDAIATLTELERLHRQTGNMEQAAKIANAKDALLLDVQFIEGLPVDKDGHLSKADLDILDTSED